MTEDDLFLRARDLFERALDLPENDRRDFVEREAAGDAPLRRDVLSLLDAGAFAGDFLAGSAIASIGGEEAWLGRRLGNYRIEGVIAGGGMGVVFRATQDHPRREVALKLIRGDALSRRSLQRFALEAELLGRLDHPGIARIYDAGTTDAVTGLQPYFVMELIDGLPLLEFAARHSLSTDARLRLIVQVCDAVEHAHGHGIIHRDLKPANILVRPDGQPKVLDFGVARSTDSDLRATTFRTDVGQMIGTLQYMSPEQARGESASLDGRSDVYAIGALTYELLTGRLPHPLIGKSVVEAVRAISDDEPDQLGSGDRRFPADLVTIVHKCLEKDRARRYDTPGALAADLRRLLASEPIAARAPGSIYRMRTFARRHRGMVLMAGAAAVALVAGLIVSVAGWTRADQARTRAEREARKAKVLSDFMSRLLESPDPWEQGPDVRVVDILEDAEQKIASDLADEPEIAARAHEALGSTYRGLTRYDRSEFHWRRSLELMEAIVGPLDPRLYTPLESLGDLYLDQGRLEAADSIAVRVRAMEPALAARPDEAVDALHFLGSLEEAHGRLDSALPYFRRAFDRARAQLGEDHSATLISESALGNLLWQLERAAEAAPILESACRKTEARHGRDYPELLAMRNNLGFVYAATGDHDRSLATFQDVLDTKRRTLGEDNMSTAIGYHAVASQLRTMARPADALPYHERAVAVATRTAGVEDARPLIFRAAWGASLLDLGRFQEARAELEPSHAGLARMLGPYHPRTRRAAESLAVASDALGDHAAAARYRAASAAPRAGNHPGAMDSSGAAAP